MLEFICSNCGKRVQAADSFAGKHVLCPVCNVAMTAPLSAQAGNSPASAIATPDHAAQAKIALPSSSSDGSFREGEPPPPSADALPSVRKEIPGIAARIVPYLIVVAIICVAVALL